MPRLHKSTRSLPLSLPWTLSRSSSSSQIPLSPLMMTTMSLPRSPSPVNWTLLNPWWCGRLPPPSSSLTLSISQTTPLCVSTTQRYTFPVTQEDPTAQSLTDRGAQYADRSARNWEGPPIDASAAKKLRPKPVLSTSHREMRSSTTWGQYIRTQGGQLRDSAYPASSRTKRRLTKKKTPVTKKITTTTKIPSQFQPWDVQLQWTQELIGDGQRLTRSQARKLNARYPPLPQDSF